jgi:hypothetical protein
MNGKKPRLPRSEQPFEKHHPTERQAFDVGKLFVSKTRFSL